MTYQVRAKEQDFRFPDPASGWEAGQAEQGAASESFGQCSVGFDVTQLGLTSRDLFVVKELLPN